MSHDHDPQCNHPPLPRSYRLGLVEQAASHCRQTSSSSCHRTPGRCEQPWGLTRLSVLAGQEDPRVPYCAVTRALILPPALCPSVLPLSESVSRGSQCWFGVHRDPGLASTATLVADRWCPASNEGLVTGRSLAAAGSGRCTVARLGRLAQRTCATRITDWTLPAGRAAALGLAQGHCQQHWPVFSARARATPALENSLA